MSFLLAKILVLLVLAALLGAGFARWWYRRHYEDVSSEYAQMSSDGQAWRNSIDERLAKPLKFEASAIASRLDAIEASLRGMQIPTAQPIDFAETHQRLAAVGQAVAAIRIPEPAGVDLAPLQAQLAQLERVDLSAVTARLQAIEQALQGFRLHAIPALDLKPVQQQLSELERALRAIVIPAPTPVDLGPVLLQLAALEARFSQAPATPAPAASSEPAESATPHALLRAGSRNLLARAAYGKPDDLKLIKGIAEVLEKMLHKVGVYYFWQIASWTGSDIAHVDTQLTAFKGRIARDEWVTQSRALARAPGAAQKPGTF